MTVLRRHWNKCGVQRVQNIRGSQKSPTSFCSRDVNLGWNVLGVHTLRAGHFFDQTAGALYDVFCYRGEDVFGCHQKARIFTENLLLIRRLASQRLQISPFVLLFRETKGSGLKSFLHPPAKSSTRFRELISVLPRRGWIAGKKKKRLFYQERLHCSLDNVFVSNADVFSRLC